MDNQNKLRGKVLIAAKVHSVLLDGLTDAGHECILEEDVTRGLAMQLVKDCVGIVTSTRLILDKELIDAAPQLRWIGRMGSGMEIIDVEYATSKGIKCYSSPEGNRNSVGEHALGMLLALTRRITIGRDQMMAGLWKREENRGIELEGKILAIIGFGNTGSAFARKLKGFDIRILAYDKYHPENITEGVINCKDLQIIYEEADIISFHLPLQNDTAHVFNDDFCLQMKKPFILINTSRGPVVDTSVLYKGLKDGKILGACLDVFEEETPFGKGTDTEQLLREIIDSPQVVVTPHIAGYSHEAIYKMSKVLLGKIGEPL